MSLGNPVIVALDYEDEQTAWQLVESLGEECDFYKVGLQLLTAAGPDFIRRLVASRKRVFLDLKILEIPNSVAGAIDAAGKLGVSMVSVHASGGQKVLDAAVKAAEPYPKLNLIALTVITSMTQMDLEQVGVNSTVEEQVMRLAKLAANCGCQGIVASAHETEMIKRNIPSDMLIVTPGIQLADTLKNDQQRVATPNSSMAAGASFLVMGRAITKAKDPAAAFFEARRQSLGR